MCNCTKKPAFTMQMANATRVEKLTGKPQAVYTNGGGIFFGELKAVKKLNICCYYTTDGKEHKIVKKK